MEKEMLEYKQVFNSFRKFNDIIHDMMNSNFRAFGSNLRILIDHCNNDPVMNIITNPLKSNEKVDFENWYNKIVEDRGSIDHYNMPTDDDERTSIIFQLLLRMNKNEREVVNFCYSISGARNINDVIIDFNEHFLIHFIRGISYKLEDILNEYNDKSDIPKDAINIFVNLGNIQNIDGDVNESKINLQ